MIQVERDGDEVVLTMLDGLHQALLVTHGFAIADQVVLDDQPPAVAAEDTAALAADPLLRLEVELAASMLEDRVADLAATQKSDAARVLGSLRPYPSVPPAVSASLTRDEAISIAGWANEAWVALRTAQLADAGQVAIGASQGDETGDMLAQVLGLADPAEDEQDIPMPAMLFAVLAESLMAAALAP